MWNDCGSQPSSLSFGGEMPVVLLWVSCQILLEDLEEKGMQ